MMLEFLWIFLLKFEDCVSNKVEPSQKDVIKNIIRDNADSLKHLSNKFPNHIIEMQIEVNEPSVSPPQKISLTNFRRLFNVHKKPSVQLGRSSLRRSQRKQPVKLSPAIVRSNDKNVKPDSKNTSSVSNTAEQVTDADNRLVYMSDLKQAVEDLEKKLNNKGPPTDESTIDDGNHPLLKKDLWELLDIASEHRSKAPSSKNISKTPGKPNRAKNHVGNSKVNQDEAESADVDSAPPGVKSISDVINLVKKGVKVQFDITKPTDRNLDWIQIKVPNTT